jgi:hypothetical protein
VDSSIGDNEWSSCRPNKIHYLYKKLSGTNSLGFVGVSFLLRYKNLRLCRFKIVDVTVSQHVRLCGSI